MAETSAQSTGPDPFRNARLLALLDRPAIWNLSQLLISGGQRATKRWAREWLAAGTSDRVLDVCCGTGEFAPLFGAGRTAAYLGIDLNAQYIDYARQRYGADAGLTFEALDATQMRFAPASFDRALLVNSLHHFADDLNRGILGEIARVLRPEGRFVLIDMVGDDRRPIQRFFLDRDRGRHLRPFAAQLALLEEYFVVERQATFDTGFTPQTIVAARPRGATEAGGAWG